MNRKTVFLLVLILFSIWAPVVNANAPTQIDLLTYRIEGTGVSVPEGYWVYGTIENQYLVNSMQSCVVEVTLLDATGAELDVITTEVYQNIVEREAKGTFLAKSTTQETVAEIEYKLESFDKSDNVNFLYLELSQIVTRDKSVEGRLTNIHENQWVAEADVIVSFKDTDGNIVDIQSWSATDYDRFNAGQSETFSISTTKDYDSVSLDVQCNRESRYMYPRMIMERPNKVGDSWTPPIGETVILGIQDDPQYGWSSITVLITDPFGNAYTVQFERSGLQDYRYTITPDVPGVWNVTWIWDQYGADGGYTLVESGVFDAGFFTWDPEAVDDPIENTTDTFDVGSMLTARGFRLIWMP